MSVSPAEPAPVPPGVHTHGLGYRADIDGLRAVAVLSVVAAHAGINRLAGGFVGVDVFFVISGFLITGLIVRDLQRGRFSLIGFWVRRARRILPALFVVTIATIAAGWFVLLPVDFAGLGKSIVAMLLFVSNVLFWRETGYFETDSQFKPLLHTWSLSVEEQFYLLLPLLLQVLARMKSARPVVTFLVFVTVASFAASVYGTYRHPGGTYYLLPTRAWELFAGSLLALVPAERLRVQRH